MGGGGNHLVTGGKPSGVPGVKKVGLVNIPGLELASASGLGLASFVTMPDTVLEADAGLVRVFIVPGVVRNCTGGSLVGVTGRAAYGSFSDPPLFFVEVLLRCDEPIEG